MTLPDDYLDMLEMKATGGLSVYDSFLLSHASEWGDWQGEAQPLDRCVHHLVALIVRTIEENSAGNDNMTLTMKEVRQWAAAVAKG